VIILRILYTISTVGLAVVGFNALVLAVTYLRHRRTETPRPVVAEDEWPTVAVQLPVYNERHVVERLVRAASALNYPRDRLTIQLLDDSTDDTSIAAGDAVERARRAGVSIIHLRRGGRAGYKAGALAYGLERTDAEFVAVFDADFVPQPDFLRLVIPYFMGDDRLGLVQTRWAHLNADTSLLTRAQALALDSHFVVEQTARHRGGLLMNFSGTGGVWRRKTITGSGGWHCDTLSEDIDLSYRAQLGGWHCLYLPDVSVPAEVPPLMMGFKRQQSRWATGTVQCLRKLGGRVLRSPLNPWQKIQAMIHLGGYFIHPLMIILLLLTLPLVLAGQIDRGTLSGLGLAMLGSPLQATIAQRSLYPDWWRRLILFPVFMLMGVGIAASNSEAVLKGFSARPQSFERTPKFHLEGQRRATWAASRYTLPVNSTTILELLLAAYAGVTAVVALRAEPALAAFMALYALGFAYVAGLSLWQSYTARRVRARHRQWGLRGSESK
jgi:cellulose synthase/poly-beta-1,6-N-acetylglucosamine synthase-like glycosyltransferase